MKARLIIICFLSISFFSEVAYSQKTYFSFGGDVALPLSSDFKEEAGYGYGGSIGLESFNNDHVVLRATAGYLSFQGKRAHLDEYEYEYDAKVSMLPIQIGLKYYPKVIREFPKGLFISGETGIMLMYKTLSFDDGTLYKDLYTDLIISTGIGYQLGNFLSDLRFVFEPREAVYHLNFRLSYSIIKK
jgi:hypothetical protein